MPKLYKSTKVDQGLRIGLREPSGSEWFADMTVDRNKRTCRKIGLEYDPYNDTNKELAIKKAKSLYTTFKEESKNKLDIACTFMVNWISVDLLTVNRVT